MQEAQNRSRNFGRILLAALVVLLLPLLIAVFVPGFKNVSWTYYNPELATAGKISVDSQGNLYVIQDSKLLKFDTNKKLVASFGGHKGYGMVFSSAFAIDNTGRIFVLDQLKPEVEIYDSNGQFLKSWGEEGTKPGRLINPEDITIDNEGFLYIIEPGLERIQKFDQDGKFIKTWGGRGDGPGKFFNPHGIAADNQGHIYIADTLNNRVQKFDTEGNFLQEWGKKPRFESHFSIFSWNVSLTINLNEHNNFNVPHDIAVDPQGNFYVADTRNYRIQKFDPNGNFITGWNNSNGFFDQLDNPGSLDVDGQGNVYVLDWSEDRILQYKL